MDPGTKGQREVKSGVSDWRRPLGQTRWREVSFHVLPAACCTERPTLFEGPGWTRPEDVKRPECTCSTQQRTAGALLSCCAVGALKAASRRPGPLPAFHNGRTFCLPSLPLFENDSSSGPRKSCPVLLGGRNRPFLPLPQGECDWGRLIRISPPTGHSD